MLAAAALLPLAGILTAADPVSAADFVVTTPDNTLFPGAVTLEGTKDVASTIRIPSPDPDAPYCVVAPDGSETWACTFTPPQGSTTVRVIEAGATTIETALTVRVLGTPALTSSQLTSGLISGSGYPGSGIVLSGDLSQNCGTVQANGFWSCSLAAASGTYSVAFTQTWNGNAAEPGGTSAAVTLTVDKDPPPVPSVSEPAAGSRVTGQPVQFAGDGQDGNRVDLYVDGTRVCSSPVSGSRWTCTVTLVDGLRTIQAIQWDAVENASGTSTLFTITVGAAATTPPGTPAPPSSPAPQPEQPAPSPTALPGPSPAPTAPFLPPPVGGQSGLPPGDTWGTPTQYGAAIPSVDAAPWMLGLALGVGFVALVALPLRLLARLRRRRPPRPQPTEDDRVLSPRVTAALALGAAVLLAALAGGIQGEARYARLILAIGIALVVLNGVGTVLATRIASRWTGERMGIQLMPRLLLIALATALVSRTAGVQPPIVMGVLLVACFPAATRVGTRAVTSVIAIGSTVAVGAAAWVGYSLLGSVEGFWLLLASETLSSMALAGLGSAAVLAVPVGRMPGRIIYEWSRPVWAATALVAAGLAAVVIGGGVGFPVPIAVGSALTLTALVVALWSWSTHVRPLFSVRA